jgi:hypothetical protein
MMTPSPGSSIYSDHFLNLTNSTPNSIAASPAAFIAASDTGHLSPGSGMYKMGSSAGSLYSNTGSDAESDVDNCTASKMGDIMDAEVFGVPDLDIIAQVLFNHPTIQAVMASTNHP